jgi:two-component system sensor histidine kinase GlrK
MLTQRQITACGAVLRFPGRAVAGCPVFDIHVSMRLYYPKSFLQLLFVGFALIALPLIFALVNSAISVDRLANRSQRAVYDAVRATQSSQRLTERLGALERTARQMLILGDRSLLDTYRIAHQQLLKTAGEFDTLPFDSRQRADLNQILKIERSIYDSFANPENSMADLQIATAQFPKLDDLAREITERSNQLIDNQIDAMRHTAATAQRIVYWQLLALLPVALFLMVGFAILITRPIRELEVAIRRLGSGQFTIPVSVSGPEDLQYLGQRLEWMRRRLVDLEEQKNRFLQQVSHELKTPLTSLREGAELLNEEVVGKLTSQQREIAQIMRAKSIELQRLIDDLLKFGAMQFHKLLAERRPVAVRALIERAAEDQRLALRGKELRLDVATEDCTLDADPEKIRVIVDNLLSNAIKFSPRAGVVGLSARRDGDRFLIDVTDQGPGIDLLDRARVFDPFFQGQNTPSGLVQGTGLGLSIVREYVGAHDGTIEVIDDGPGSGAHLRVSLPIQDVEQA